MAKKKSKATGSKSQTFEQSLEQLRSVVGELENGNLTLDESLKKYELGVSSLKACYQSLNQVQRRIELLVDLDDEGNLVTQQFDDTASDQVTEGTRRPSRRTRPANGTGRDDISERGVDGEDEDLDGVEVEDMDDPNRLF